MNFLSFNPLNPHHFTFHHLCSTFIINLFHGNFYAVMLRSREVHQFGNIFVAESFC